jgi:hemerythrin-like domain-containing protein
MNSRSESFEGDQPPTTDVTDATAVLDQEHRELQDLFRRVSSPDEDRSAVLKTLMQTLAAHVTMEKQIVLPALRDGGDVGEAAAGELSEQHADIERILTLLERRKVNSPDVPGLVTELLDDTNRHIEVTDDKVLPALRSLLSDPQRKELGGRMNSDERQLLTHSHPHLPTTGPLADITRKVAETVDGLRDRSSDIGRTAS